jgi:hypothetical protein
MDKINEINKCLAYIKRSVSNHDEMPYEILHEILEEVDRIADLISGCVDNSKIMSDLPTMKELKDFIWKCDMASAELTSFIDSNHSVSELDRVDEASKFLDDALYENCQGSEMTFLQKMEELMKYFAYIQQEGGEEKDA